MSFLARETANPCIRLPPMSEWFERFGFGEVADNLLTGAYPRDRHDVAVLAGERVTSILNLCEDCEYGSGERDAVAEALRDAGIRELRVASVDYGELIPSRLEEATDAVLAWPEAGGRVS